VFLPDLAKAKALSPSPGCRLMEQGRLKGHLFLMPSRLGVRLGAAIILLRMIDTGPLRGLGSLSLGLSGGGHEGE
jgi:hypothetical protein